MDQDAFRQLLATSRREQPSAKQLGAPRTANGVTSKVATIASSEPAFKPRKVKKSEGKYRDRAAERREGIGNDYAEVEAVLEDFERRVAHEDKDVIEQQRKYLGGDSEHTILVKGLDMSLLEQNRARVGASPEDDDILEQAFAQATSTSEPTERKKRTREDIIRDLKAKRQNNSEKSLVDQPVAEKELEGDRLPLEATESAGKFKPIGFKPIGQIEERLKKRKVKGGEGAKKKKQRVGHDPILPGMKMEPVKETSTSSPEQIAPEPSSSKMPQKSPEQEAESLGQDFDIFSGAGDYQALLDDEESEEEHRGTKETQAGSVTEDAVPPDPMVGVKGWFNETEPDASNATVLPEKSPPIPETIATEEQTQEMRLRPLESSALPSIRDFLAMDEAVEKAEKRKARKEKKKKKKSGDDDDD